MVPENKSQNEYLWQWKREFKDYINLLMVREAPPLDQLCAVCKKDGVYKCHGCFNEPLFCMDCCRTQHQRHPFHRISQWTRSFFQETSLIKVGLHIHLAHDSNPCPSSTEYTSDLFDWSDTDENIDYDDYLEGASIPLVTDSDHPAITIVDKSGVHFLSIWYCHCPSALDRDMQLFQAGLFPASFTRPKTAFTFSILDDFLLDNLECGTSAMNYYSKMRRLTSSIFPLMVPDRYRELMRTARQWRQCKLYKWCGFAHKDDQPKSSELALFCLACPQLGINLNLSTGTGTEPTNTPSWLFIRTLVMDGNFKAEHLYLVNPSDEVSLMDGLAFMSDCNNHHAVNQANAFQQKLEATGIGGCACARHGCFVPHSMVDFHKDGISHVITFYDINCQYNKFLKDWIASSIYLSIPMGMNIIPGVKSRSGLGSTVYLWHVHGHQDSCYVRYASNFIHGTGRIDREIMETIWASLNIISPSARGMGTPHRKEFLCRKFKEAARGAEESKLSFQNLNETAHPDMVLLWEAEEALAQANRMGDPTAMDIYEVRLEKGKKQQDLHLLEAQNCPDHLVTNSISRRGAATWLATGLTIEESQIALSRDVKRLGKHPTDIQLLRVARLRDKLQTRISSFLKMAPTYLGFGVDVDEPDPPVDMPHHTSLFQPELTVIPLPSNLRMDKCNALDLTNLMKEETALHEGQANDALHAIRVHLGDKAVIFQTTVQSAKSQASSTRAWTQVRLVEAAVNLNARIYSKCRSQLAKLPDHELLMKYLPLKKEHLKASAAVADPNARGQRDITLPWFWSINVQGDTSRNDWMTEFYRVNWLQTKALHDHWNEDGPSISLTTRPSSGGVT
ncbi:uncharacterized protein EDB93DRAFT_1240507 [Suillus bovinus]|uniref:uncharacterized protein n=1 Tax=Suillus bovinus TaxID=48563 RepID=UPI001B86C7A1|nr:uncharacterized protein EDB93DRAFT_1240507 [Suillus bovinus]KAG2148165.1 hypothetical protein EDB93DRAFT_1240507 [Suillus bovinus]